MLNKRKIVKEYEGTANIRLACLLGFHSYDFNSTPVYCVYCGKIK